MSTVHIMHLCSLFMRAHTPKRKKGAAFAEQVRKKWTIEKRQPLW